ncbi:MAG: UDP-glucose/GDP-mannose dehydrogenase family protein, partial [Nitrospirae bacterium]
KFTTDLARAVDESLVIFIAVGTPSRPDGSADLTFVDEVARSIGSRMTGYKVVVTKSTVPVGTARRVRELIESHQETPCPFGVVSNPEFLREGSAIEDFMRPNRVVIGADSSEAVAIMKDLYRPLYLIETPIVITDIATAEMIKYASNVFLATKISFINEMANLCELVNADVQVVAKAMGLDKRIGPKFLHAGPGFGGSCFGKDTAALIHIAEQAGYSLKIAAATKQVNEQQRVRMVEKIRTTLDGVQGKTIGLLGLSFKPNTNDIRDSPALDIAQALMREGALVRAYDPEALEESCQLLPDLVPCRDAYHAAEGADALVLVTEWNQFRNLDLAQLKSLLRFPIMIDLRNVYDPQRMAQAGFRYVSVGRPPVGQNPLAAG